MKPTFELKISRYPGRNSCGHDVNPGDLYYCDGRIGLCPACYKVATTRAAVRLMNAELGCLERGRPSYRWVERWQLITPDGRPMLPPMSMREARAYCRTQGWTIDNSRLQRCPGCGAIEIIPPWQTTCNDCSRLPAPEPQPDHIKYAENPPL